jgi:hypothetical protein
VLIVLSKVLPRGFDERRQRREDQVSTCQHYYVDCFPRVIICRNNKLSELIINIDNEQVCLIMLMKIGIHFDESMINIILITTFRCYFCIISMTRSEFRIAALIDSTTN